MRSTDEKFKYILPYAAKRAFKILFKVKPESQKKYEKEYKAYQRRVNDAKKDAR